MKRLTETAMFRQLSMPGAFNPDETVLKTMYDDFAHAVVDICTTVEDDNIPAYFTLHYTRLELEQLSLVATAKGTGEKCRNRHLPA